MKNIWGTLLLVFGIVVAGCDLQPKIASIADDDVGGFISERYPTLLAEPDSEIYQTAVADYGMYASPTVYGNGDVSDQDYVLYSPTDDYNMPAQETHVTESGVDTPTDDNTDTSDADDTDDSGDEDTNDAEYGFAPDTDVDDLTIPDYVTPENETLKVGDKPAPQPIAKPASIPAPRAATKPVEKVVEKPVVKPEVKAATKQEKPVETPKTQPNKKPETQSATGKTVTVAKGDTLYSLSHKYSVTVDDFAAANNLKAPFALSVGQKLKVPESKPEVKLAQKQDKPVEKTVVKPTTPEQKPVAKVEAKTKPETKSAPRTATKADFKTTTATKPVVRAPLREITVKKGDTLYSISREYSVPVNDLAVMNKISAPFALSVGQKIKVPDIASAKKVEAKKTDAKPVVNKATKKSVEKPAAKSAKTVKQPAKTATKKTDVKKPAVTQASKKVEKTAAKTPVKTQTKKADTPKKQRQSEPIAARSSSKFSWPVRGKILSGYGSKSNGLFNDGINIQANKGATVVAAENGYVAYAGNEVKGMGNLVIIQHADGWMTVYAHMDSFVVRRGHKVTVGQKIGTVGKSGKVDIPQLHFEIRKGTKAYNPVNYLKK